MRMNKFFRSPKTLWHFAACGAFGLWMILAALTSSLFAQRLPFLQHPRSMARKQTGKRSIQRLSIKPLKLAIKPGEEPCLYLRENFVRAQ